MRVEVFANPNTFHVLKAVEYHVECLFEYTAQNGWRVYRCDTFPSRTVYPIDNSVNLLGKLKDHSLGDRFVEPLTAIHEMVYQPKQVFSDVDGVVALEHGKFWIVERPGGQVCFQVLEMDEEFRALGECNLRHTTANEMCVYSGGAPQLFGQRIYLRGTSKSNDLIIDVSKLLTRTQIIEALVDWDKNWNWTRKTPTLSECCKYGSVEGGGMFVFDSEVGK